MDNLHKIIEELRHRRAEFANRLERIRHDKNRVDGPVSADFNEQVVERENDEVLANLERTTVADLQQMDHALQRVEAGLYPICETCGDRIEMDRLRAMPHATVCAGCLREAAKKSPKPMSRARH